MLRRQHLWHKRQRARFYKKKLEQRHGMSEQPLSGASIKSLFSSPSFGLSHRYQLLLFFQTSTNSSTNVWCLLHFENNDAFWTCLWRSGASKRGDGQRHGEEADFQTHNMVNNGQARSRQCYERSWYSCSQCEKAAGPGLRRVYESSHFPQGHSLHTTPLYFVPKTTSKNWMIALVPSLSKIDISRPMSPSSGCLNLTAAYAMRFQKALLSSTYVGVKTRKSLRWSMREGEGVGLGGYIKPHIGTQCFSSSLQCSTLFPFQKRGT
jgi:hypothetical protein